MNDRSMGGDCIHFARWYASFRRERCASLMNVWPPFVGAGIRVRHIAPDFRSVTVDMRLRWSNRNYVGTHFGGSLYAMADPFLMVMLLHNSGRGVSRVGQVGIDRIPRARAWPRLGALRS